MQFLYSVLVTLLIEVPLAFLFLRFFLYANNKNLRLRIFCITSFASLITMPYVWFVLPYFINDYNLYFIIAESLVIIAESLIYYTLLELRFQYAIIVSFLTNVISAIAGKFL